MRAQGYLSISDIAKIMGVTHSAAKERLFKQFHEGKFERVEVLLQTKTMGLMYRPKR